MFTPGSLPEPTCWVRSPSPGATVKVFTTCSVLSGQKGVLICPQELQGANRGSLSQPRACPTTSVALPGLGQSHSGYTHEYLQVSICMKAPCGSAPPCLSPPRAYGPHSNSCGERLRGGYSSLEPLLKMQPGLFPPRKQRLSTVEGPTGPHSPSKLLRWR